MFGLDLTYVVPVYNTEAFVLRCLQSLVNQNIPDDKYEILVVDDGSSDRSRAIVETFAQEHAQVTFLTQENAGVSSARNLALDHASGRYIQFVDSDDYLEQGVMASLLLRALELDVDMLMFDYQSVSVDGAVSSHSSGYKESSSCVVTGVDFLDNHTMTPYIWRFLIRRDFINHEPWRFDPSLIVCEDGALIAHLLLCASRVAYVESSPYRYMLRDNSAMHNQDAGHLRQRLISQIDAASSINETIRRFEVQNDRKVPASVTGLRNVYLFFAMTKALTSGLVDDVLKHLRQAGLYPFPCLGPGTDYYGKKWKVIHALMMRPSVWKLLSRIYCRFR